jgi:hypothetical protein
MLAAFVSSTAAQAQSFSGDAFEINRERVTFGTIKSCAKSASYLVPTTYLYVSARTKLSAGGGLGNAGAKARVFVQGLGKSELQELAGKIQDEIVGQLRAAGYTVLTYADVKADVADKERMKPNPRYGMPTQDSRAFPNTDFVVATPNDEQTLDYGMQGPQTNYGKAAQRTGATLLLPQVYLTLPQLGASATNNYRSSSASITFDPAMHFAGSTVLGLTAKGAWCSIIVPEHGMRLPALVAGDFQDLSVTEEDYGDWGTKHGDFSFVVDDAAFRTGTLAVGRSLAKLIADTMNGKK